MKKIIYLAILVIACGISYYMGSHNVYMAKDVNKDGSESIWYPHSENIIESLSIEREFANSLFEGLHFFYQEYPTIWEKFEASEEYAKIETINNGDWEDFYVYWE